MLEPDRPLLPVGYRAGVEAYRKSVAELTVDDLSNHYRGGLEFFHDEFVPHLKRTLVELAGGEWNLDDYVAYAAGSDVDLIAHIIDGAAGDSIAGDRPVRLFPGDWYGFLVGSARPAGIAWDSEGSGGLACLCVPSVRNGHLTAEMLDFLSRADARLLNVNLFPTLSAGDRRQTARDLAPLLDRSILSISFSRGFGLTASQLGVILVHRDHPLRLRFRKQWEWFTYFYNALAARAFMLIDLSELRRVDTERHREVHTWLTERGLPVVESGTYNVKSFRTDQVPEYLAPLARDSMVRLCFKPTGV
jgi:hypothetical protein